MKRSWPGLSATLTMPEGQMKIGDSVFTLVSSCCSLTTDLRLLSLDFPPACPLLFILERQDTELVSSRTCLRLTSCSEILFRRDTGSAITSTKLHFGREEIVEATQLFRNISFFPSINKHPFGLQTLQKAVTIASIARSLAHGPNQPRGKIKQRDDARSSAAHRSRPRARPFTVQAVDGRPGSLHSAKARGHPSLRLLPQLTRKASGIEPAAHSLGRQLHTKPRRDPCSTH